MNKALGAQWRFAGIDIVQEFRRRVANCDLLPHPDDPLVLQVLLTEYAGMVTRTIPYSQNRLERLRLSILKQIADCAESEAQ